MTARSPSRYHGSWLWPIGGYYDVYADDNGRPDEFDPQATGLSLSEAKAWIDNKREAERVIDALNHIVRHEPWDEGGPG